jgi:hypothetical protein
MLLQSLSRSPVVGQMADRAPAEMETRKGGALENRFIDRLNRSPSREGSVTVLLSRGLWVQAPPRLPLKINNLGMTFID